MIRKYNNKKTPDKKDQVNLIRIQSSYKHNYIS